MEQALPRNAAIAALTRSPHGDLSAYAPEVEPFIAQDPEFLAHLVAWNHLKGQVRDAKLALPVLSTRVTEPSLAENGYAHLALASPRDFLRGCEWARKGNIASNSRLRKLVGQYLAYRTRTPSRASRLILQHRKVLKGLYAQYHVKPDPWVEKVLFLNENLGPNALLRSLATMTDHEAAETIVREHIPFLLLPQALGPRLKSEPLVLALIESMSPAELTNNSKMLQKLGIDDVPSLRSAYREAIGRASTSSRVSSLKLSQAAEVLSDSETRTIVKAAAQTQVKSLGVKGDWLVIIDVSGSMQHSIELGLNIGAHLAAVAEGQVRLSFVNHQVRGLDATGKTLEELKAMTRGLQAGGGTLLGQALIHCQASGFIPDGIAMVTDGADNGPTFVTAYSQVCKVWGKEPPVYVYEVCGDVNSLARHAVAADLSFSTFDLRAGVDLYSLPNLIQTMRTNRFSLSDEVFATPLLSLADVFA